MSFSDDKRCKMTLKDLKYSLVNSTGHSVPYEVFLDRLYKMIKELNIPGTWFESSTLWILGKPTRIFELDGVLFCVQVASGTYRLFGLPVSGDYNKVVNSLRLCLELGISVSFDEKAFPELSDLEPSCLNDNHNYYKKEIDDYMANSASHQSKKTFRRLDRENTVTVVKASDLSVKEVSRILEINKIWLIQFKEEKKGSSDTLSYIDNILANVKRFNNNYFLIYTDNETGEIVAYDYIEVWNKQGIVSAGKCIIPKLSTFRYVTYKIVEALHNLGAEYCSIGGTRFYNLNKEPVLSGGSYNLDSLYEAKMSLPNEVTFTKVFKFNIKKFNAVNLDESATNELF